MTQLHLAVDIADAVLHADQRPGTLDIERVAARLVQRHPEAETSFEEVAETLAEEFCASV